MESPLTAGQTVNEILMSYRIPPNVQLLDKGLARCVPGILDPYLSPEVDPEAAEIRADAAGLRIETPQLKVLGQHLADGRLQILRRECWNKIIDALGMKVTTETLELGRW
jgi:hypothetical protein